MQADAEGAVKNSRKVKIFISYEPGDDSFRKDLEKHLSGLKQEQRIEVWSAFHIEPGKDREQEVRSHLNDAQLILLLISATYQASEECKNEMAQALERMGKDNVRVIPIVLRPFDWQQLPIGHLEALPNGAKPVTDWKSKDHAFADITQRIRTVVDQLAQKSTPDNSLVNFGLIGTKRAALMNLYLKNVVAVTRQLPWGYLPGDFTSTLEIDDIYCPSHLSEQKHSYGYIEDEWMDRDRAGHFNQKLGMHHLTPQPWFSLSEMIQMGNNASLLGYIGSGKSMAASYLALRLAKGEGQSKLGLTQPRIPLLLPLGNVSGTPASDLLTVAIEYVCVGMNAYPALAPCLKQEWNEGNILLILDALDEFQGDKKWISREINRLADKSLHRSSLILTSRPGAYRLMNLLGLQAFTLEDLDRDDIADFVETWVKAFVKTTGSAHLDVQKHTRSLTQDIDKHPLVQEIVSNPLLLTILTILSLRPGGIQLAKVRTEAQLFKAFVSDLIDRDKSKGSSAPDRYGTHLLHIVFAYVGFEAQRAQSGLFENPNTYHSLLAALAASRYFRHAGEIQASIDAEAILQFWLNTGLIQQSDDIERDIRFRHQAFQYFGAALFLTMLNAEQREKTLNEILAHPEWEHVHRLYTGLIHHPQSLLE